MAAKSQAKWPAEYVGERVKLARESRRWKQSDLVAQLEELGFRQWRQSKVAKIENGEIKRLALDDVIALAAALGVQMPHLLAPADGDVQVAPNVRRSAAEFRLWLRGLIPLDGADERMFFVGPLVPDQEWREFVTGVGIAGARVVAPGASIEVTPGVSIKTDPAETIRLEEGA